MTIHELARQPGNMTDKEDEAHSFHGETYLHVYERYFEPLREQKVRVLEIGILFGWSIRLWRDYFPQGLVIGMDIDPERRFESERIVTMTGDQSDDGDLDKVIQLGPFNIVVDDGSHISWHIVHSFNRLWPSIVPGGFYCIEDMRCTYSGTDSGWPGMKLNKPPAQAEGRHHIDAMLKALISDMDNLRGDIRAIHIHPMQIVIQKV